MKRIGFLYEKMLDKALIKSVILKGSIGKRKRRDVKKVLEDVDGYTNKIYDLLVTNTYHPTVPNVKTIHDKSSGKIRQINVVPYFPDGIMHQLVAEVLKPVFMRGMYYWSCASIPKRGNNHAIKYVKRVLKKDAKGTKYCVKMDIYHYYESIPIDLLMKALERKVKDKKLLSLVRLIVESNPNKGLSIGFYINQWLANFYLESLDHFICTLDGVKYYVRNMDDIVVFGSNKKKLHNAIREIIDFLVCMGLKPKQNWQLFKTDSRGVDFVGYRFFHDYALLRRRNFMKLSRQSRKTQKRIKDGTGIPFHIAAGIISRAGMLKHCSGVNIRQKYIDCIGIEKLKSIVRAFATKQESKYRIIPQMA